jgi:hypothetical protein
LHGPLDNISLLNKAQNFDLIIQGFADRGPFEPPVVREEYFLKKGQLNNA